MFSQSLLTARRAGLAATLLLALALGYSPAQAQVAPTPAPAKPSLPKDVAYYLDGQPANQNVLAKVTPADIQDINVVKGAQQQQLFGTTHAGGTVVVTTKAKADTPEVLAFTKRLHEVVPLVPASPAQTAAVAAITAYMAKTYPAAKLEFISPHKEQADRYQAIFTNGGQRLQLLFNGQGQPVKP